ncbi:MAG: anaerobic ribonucleoside-triphosphate reductase activating protein [Thermodesulfobacteriota bacterium]
MTTAQPGQPPIKGFLETSFVDWPGTLCAILFVGGCNFRCPFCHNHPLVLAPEELDTIPFAEVLARLNRRRYWLEGVCVSGGEPTLFPGLPAMIAHLKAEGWAVKLDTNGSRPKMLARLLDEGLLDMVAMDVKAPLVQAKYDAAAGCGVDLAAIEKSIALITASGIPHEFRMTVVPGVHGPAEISDWVGLFDQDRSRIKLQNFSPKTTLDPRFEEVPAMAAVDFSRLQELVAAL